MVAQQYVNRGMSENVHQNNVIKGSKLQIFVPQQDVG